MQSILMSKCLTGELCRYDKQQQSTNLFNIYKHNYNIISFCPEEELLGTPRKPIKRVLINSNHMILQKESNINYYNDLVHSCETFFTTLDTNDLVGIILKSKSPTCGYKDTKIYNNIKPGSSYQMGNGLLTEMILNRIENIPIESDGRLNNLEIRRKFELNIEVISNIISISTEKMFISFKKYISYNLLVFSIYNKSATLKLHKLISNFEYNKNDLASFKNECILLANQIFNKLPSDRNKLSVIKTILSLLKKDKIQYNEDYFNITLPNFKVNPVIYHNILEVLKYIIIDNNSVLINQTIFK